jgi:transcriptional regulator with XRE-family HTH domain
MLRNNSAPMARKALKVWKTLYIGPWLTRLDRRAGEVATKAGIDVAYMSQLISGEKNNPSGDMLMRLSTELGISVNALYSPPPAMDVTDRVRKLRPEQFEALSALLDEFGKGRDRK